MATATSCFFSKHWYSVVSFVHLSRFCHSLGALYGTRMAIYGTDGTKKQNTNPSKSGMGETPSVNVFRWYHATNVIVDQRKQKDCKWYWQLTSNIPTRLKPVSSLSAIGNIHTSQSLSVGLFCPMSRKLERAYFIPIYTRISFYKKLVSKKLGLRFPDFQ